VAAGENLADYDFGRPFSSAEASASSRSLSIPLSTESSSALWIEVSTCNAFGMVEAGILTQV
jgi:hypothetical protein